MQTLVSYEVLNIDLSVARIAGQSSGVLVANNNRVKMIYLNDAGAGVVQIAIGGGAPFLLKENRPLKFRHPFDGAINIINAAQGAIIAQIIVVYGDDLNETEPFTLGAA